MNIGLSLIVGLWFGWSYGTTTVRDEQVAALPARA
jgi:hypothetical protein